MVDEFDGFDASRSVSTGHLPDRPLIDSLLLDAWERYRGLDEGAVADYIPALAAADPSLFGLCVAEVDGTIHAAGDVDHEFSIQSISKAFVFALVCQERGYQEVLERVGVDNTGLPFNSVMAIELNDGHPMNPMVNAGALVTTSLVPGASAAAKWEYIQNGLSAFAGRRLALDVQVYESEAATNQRNQGITRLLQSYGRMEFDPLETTDVYTRQCSLLVSARDLAVMAATLADGGVNPITREQVVDPAVCIRVLAALASSGLYEHSGEWLYEIGMPGKSGVSGGIVTIAPGKGGLATFSPRLDVAGNSVRGKRATRYLSGVLGLNLFASAAAADDGPLQISREW
ncbi:glutaminase A [Glaciibacter flavus]|uniref:glutaminase A n=1 Tax=Orlajensenia flava TaxID=2565934 RepID=UPI003AFFD964